MGTPCVVSVAGTKRPVPRCEDSACGPAHLCVGSSADRATGAAVESVCLSGHRADLVSSEATVVDFGNPQHSPSPIDSIVVTALVLWFQHPDEPALHILDKAMQAHEGEDLDFQFDDELMPPHPFAELVRRAFAPHLDPLEVLATMTESNVQRRTPLESTRKEWSLAVERFSERYGIWTPEA